MSYFRRFSLLSLLLLSACGEDDIQSSEQDSPPIRRPGTDFDAGAGSDAALGLDTGNGAGADCDSACRSVDDIVCNGLFEVATCGEDLDGDGCFDLVPLEECAGGDRCQAGVCEAPNCEDECGSMGARLCTGAGDGVLTCGDFDGDPCLEWQQSACPDSSVCSAGSCEGACTDECSAVGETTCTTASTLQTCGDFDTDGCLEWGPVESCNAGQTCVDGACEAGGTCSDECSLGQTMCSSGTLFTCERSSSDGCLYFGAPQPCASGQCEGNTCYAAPVASECALFSEYVESADTKAIEVFNCGSATIPADTIGICLIANSNVDCSTTAIIDEVLANGAVVTHCNNNFSHSACRYTGVANFNGDDRLVLFKDLNGDGEFSRGDDEVLDAFGVSVQEPGGRIWEDLTLRRCSLDAFDGTGSFNLNSYWTSFAGVDVSDLGVAPFITGCP